VFFCAPVSAGAEKAAGAAKKLARRVFIIIWYIRYAGSGVVLMDYNLTGSEL
jgi:hypothetical protein